MHTIEHTIDVIYFYLLLSSSNLLWFMQYATESGIHVFNYLNWRVQNAAAAAVAARQRGRFLSIRTEEVKEKMVIDVEINPIIFSIQVQYITTDGNCDFVDNMIMVWMSEKRDGK